MIFGGSQGAPAINHAVVDAVPHFNQRKYQVLFATGRKRFADVQKLAKNTTIGDNVKIVPYITNMPAKLPKVAALVSRAGATTIAEVTALGVPTIMIPSPYVTANHQVHNAQSLVNKKAALMITEDQLSGDSLMAAADKLMDNPKLRSRMAANSKKSGHPHAADDLIKVMHKAIDEHK